MFVGSEYGPSSGSEKTFERRTRLLVENTMHTFEGYKEDVSNGVRVAAKITAYTSLFC
jgi:hypothetical protein